MKQVWQGWQKTMQVLCYALLDMLSLMCLLDIGSVQSLSRVRLFATP